MCEETQRRRSCRPEQNISPARPEGAREWNGDICRQSKVLHKSFARFLFIPSSILFHSPSSDTRSTIKKTKIWKKKKSKLFFASTRNRKKKKESPKSTGIKCYEYIGDIERQANRCVYIEVHAATRCRFCLLCINAEAPKNIDWKINDYKFEFFFWFLLFVILLLLVFNNLAATLSIAVSQWMVTCNADTPSIFFFYFFSPRQNCRLNGFYVLSIWFDGERFSNATEFGRNRKHKRQN